MRRFAIVLGALLAGCAQHGTVVTIDISALPLAHVDHVELVLTTGATTASAQRTEEVDFTPAAVTASYFVQLGAVGGLTHDQLVSPLTAIELQAPTALTAAAAAAPVSARYRVFAIAYDAAGDALGVGTYAGGPGTMPEAITIAADSFLQYTAPIVVHATTPATLDGSALGSGASAIVSCAQTPSGLVWQPGDPSTQLRVVFAEPGSTSAASRTPAFDLDCDGFPAVASSGGSGGSAALDCDDLIAAVNPSAVATCDPDEFTHDPSCGAQVGIGSGSCAFDQTSCGVATCDLMSGDATCDLDLTCLCNAGDCAACSIGAYTNLANMQDDACPASIYGIGIGPGICDDGCTATILSRDPALMSTTITILSPTATTSKLDFTVGGPVPASPAAFYVELVDAGGPTTIVSITLSRGDVTTDSDLCPTGTDDTIVCNAS